MTISAFQKRLVFAIAILLLLLPFLQPGVLKAASDHDAGGWKSIAAGVTHNLGVKWDGTVWSWGAGPAELFGDHTGARTTQDIPLQIKGLSSIIAVSAGGSHSLALKDDGTVWAWGDNTEGELGDGTKSVYNGATRSYIANENKAVPVQVEGLRDVVSIASGFADSYAIKSDGTVWAWGSLLGTKPLQLTAFDDIKSISVGYGHLVALKKDGTVWQRDYDLPSVRNGVSQSLGTPTLTQIKGISDVVAIAAGGGTTHVLRSDGSVWGWGYNGEGEIGDGTTFDRPNPVKITGVQDVKAIASSAGGPFYLKQDGSVWSNGSNLGGQLGIGSYENRLRPGKIPGLAKIKQIASSGIGFRAMAIRQDHALFSWGNGYVGDGSKWWRTSPVWIKSNADDTFVETPITVEVNGIPVDFDQQPIVKDGRTLVPLRQIFEALNAEVNWDEAAKTVTGTRGQTSVKLVIGASSGHVNGQAVPLETPAETVNGRTLVPARFISESFGGHVDWDPATKTVMINVDEETIAHDPIAQDTLANTHPLFSPNSGLPLKWDQAVGRIIGANGEGLPDLYVSIRPVSETTPLASASVTNKDGYFTISGLQKDMDYIVSYQPTTGAYNSPITHNGMQYWRNQQDSFTFKDSGKLEPIVLEPVQLTGKLVDQNDKPLENIHVWLEDKDGKNISSFRFQSGADGTYYLSGLKEDESYTISLMKFYFTDKPLLSIDYQKLSFTYKSWKTKLPDIKVTIKDL
ncbi:stalk domain-containing protein [Paenibacillus sp. CAU 1782]